VSAEQKPWGTLVVGDDGSVQAIVKHRREYVVDEDYSLDPGTMVGSAFLVTSDGTVLWQGVVVGEPQAGRYLVELDKLEEGVEKVQRLFTLDTMMGLGDEGKRMLEGGYGEARAPVVDPTIEWRFYDSVEAAQEAYRAWADRADARAERSAAGGGAGLPAMGA
jgi:hypothetical protein